MSRRSLALALPLVGLALIFAPTLAHAQQVQELEMPPSEVAARGHYLMALEAYRAGHFADAVREFQEAHQLAPQHHQLLFNLFLAQRDAGQTADAVASLRAYLEAVPDAENAELLRARLATMEAQVAAEQERASTMTEPPPPDTTTTTTTTPPPPVAPPAHHDPSAAPWVLVGVGGAAAIAAIITGVLTASTYASIDSSCPGGTCPAGYDLEGQRSTGTTLALTTDVLGAVGGVAMAVGIVWGIVDLTSGSSDTSSASVQCTPLGCRGRF